MAFLVHGDVSSYRNSLNTVNAELQRLKADMKKLIDDGNVLKKEIITLSSQIVNIDSTMNRINKKLDDSCFQGFHVQKKTDDPNKYEAIRDDGTPAHGLSEEERNFISFLYFYHKVLGRETADSTFRNRIVVIDAPVSSMDSSSLFIMSSIVRELISIGFNNGSPAKPNAPRFIKQIFVLTHNAFFHKKVSYDWKEYNEVISSSSMMRIVRQILEYYFIQISGYEG